MLGIGKSKATTVTLDFTSEVAAKIELVRTRTQAKSVTERSGAIMGKP